MVWILDLGLRTSIPNR